MPVKKKRTVRLHGTRFKPAKAAAKLDHPCGDEIIQVTVVVRPRQRLEDPHGDPSRLLAPSHLQRGMSRKEFADRHGADRADLARVERFAEEHGFEVLESSARRRRVVLRGTCDSMSKAFGVGLVHFEEKEVRYRGTTGSVRVPEELAGVVQTVLGLHNRPIARPRFAITAGSDPSGAPFSATELTELYRFPEQVDGAGQTIGIIALGGGYRRSDLDAFFASLGLTPPRVTDVLVDHRIDKAREGKNDPAPLEELAQFAALIRGEPDGKFSERAQFTFETTMDIEIAGAAAPGAHIVVYFAPSNDEQGLYSALYEALHDETHEPAVLSMSWSWREPQEIRGSHEVNSTVFTINEILSSFVRVGTTFCAATGDDGLEDDQGKPCVQFPASSPFALACGGTTIEASGGAITKEVVWNRTIAGNQFVSVGGVSRIFERPFWQVGLSVPRPPTCCHQGGRGVPDVAAVADGTTSCRIRVGDEQVAASGTSAVAPLWAGLIARINQALGRPVGFLNPFLYRAAADGKPIFRDISEGTNGVYVAGKRWDACTGLGSPIGDELLAALDATVSSARRPRPTIKRRRPPSGPSPRP